MIEENRERIRVRSCAYDYLGYRARTVLEMRRYLLKKDPNGEHVEFVIRELLDKGYLDDQQYAIDWAESRRRTRGWGSYRLRQELQKKGINTEWIDMALGGDADMEFGRAMEKARKRYRRVQGEPWIEVERKLGPYLVREGFSRDIIYKVFGELRSSHNQDGEKDDIQ